MLRQEQGAAAIAGWVTTSLAVACLGGCEPTAFAPSPSTTAPPVAATECPSAPAADGDEPRTHCLRARVIAVGLQSVYGVRQVGMFHTGGPIPGNPAFLMQTRPGKMLDPERLLLASGSNFGAAPAQAEHAPGAVLSIDPRATHVLVVPPDLGAAGGQAEAAGGAVRLYTVQSAAFANSHHNRAAATAGFTAVAGPRYISINNAFGRPWIANSPLGLQGQGSNSVVDPDGRPLDNAPSAQAGGVFAGTLTPRRQVLVHEGRSGVAARALDYRPSRQLTPGDLSAGALGTAFLGASPDGSNFAVFAVASGNGAVTQVHVQDGVDGLAPPGTVLPLVVDDEPAVLGIAFKWNAERALYVADPGRDRIAVLHLDDDGRRHFKLTRTSELRAPTLRQPIDIAAAIPELANPRFASHTTLAAGSDLYVLNRGDGSLLRLALDGRVLARAQVAVPGLGIVGGERWRAFAVSADASRIWLTLQGELPTHPGHPGVLLEVSAFDANGSFGVAPPQAPLPSAAAAAGDGESVFRKEFTAAEGLGPAFNARSCVACHNEPSAGGMSSNESQFVLRIARVQPTTGRLDALGSSGPIAHRHGLNGTATGIPRGANVSSQRMPPALYEMALIDRVADEAILAHAVNKGDGIRGRPNRVPGADGKTQLGRYGWKADIASLDEMVAAAYDNELGISSPLAPRTRPTPAESAFDDDGTLVRAVSAYLRQLQAPARAASPR